MINIWNNMSEEFLLQIEAIRESLEPTKKGGIKQTKQNCVIVLENDPVLKGAIKNNLLSGRMDIVKDVGWRREETSLTDDDLSQIYLYMEVHYDLINEKNIQNAIHIVANRHTYHPIRDYLNSLEWDGQERMGNVLHHFLGADNGELTRECMKIFMLGAIERVFHPGCKYEAMLCLVGDQGVGKSSFFRFLAIKDEWFSDVTKDSLIFINSNQCSSEQKTLQGILKQQSKNRMIYYSDSYTLMHELIKSNLGIAV